MQPIPDNFDRRLFSMLGGPLHRLGIRLGLVRHHTRTVRLGLAIAFLLWGVSVLLAWSLGVELLTFAMLGAHVRLLLVIPLMFIAESLLDPRMDGFIRVAIRSRVVPGESTARLLEVLARIDRVRDMWLPEALCLLLAVALIWLAPLLHIPGTDSTLQTNQPVHIAAAGWWYSIVCLTVLRFLALRLIWRLLLWFYCLWKLSRLPLRLVPAHSDGMAGLGALEMVHLHLAPLILAISSALAASFAVDINAGAMKLDAVYPAIAAILILDAVLVIAPLMFFSGQLWASKVKGVGDYMVLAERYSARFERKWIHGAEPEEELLGTGDIQSLADLTTAIDVVRGVRIVPISPGVMLNLAMVALIPMLPLLLFKYPMAELIGQMLGRLTGL
jgi:hypothetical protein